MNWQEEFEKLMPKNSGETMSYGQFSAVRTFIATLIEKIIEDIPDKCLHDKENNPERKQQLRDKWINPNRE